MLDFTAFEGHLIRQIIDMPEIIDEQLVTQNLFYDHAYREIFGAILKGREKSPSLDDFIILEILRENKQEACFHRLMEIPSVSPGSAVFYVTHLKERRQRDEIVKALSVALAAASDESKTGVEIADLAESAITNALQKIGEEPSPLIKDRAPICYNEIKNRVQQNREGKRNNLDFGIASLDEFVGDIRPGEVVCIAARPGCGKTALALQFAAHVSGDIGKHTAFFSLEMYAQEVQERLLSLVNVAPVSLLRSGNLNDAQVENVRQACIMFEGFNLSIYDKDHSFELLRARIRREKAVHNTQLVIIDYLGLVDVGQSGKIPRWERMGDLSKNLKILAQEVGVVVVECVQLVRDADGREPSIAQLRDSGSIEQDADRIILLNPIGDIDIQGRRQITAIVAKNRHGPIGKATLLFTGNHVRFEDEKGIHDEKI